MSSMYELIFGLSVVVSAYLSALSLLLFVLVRAAIPWYIMDSRYPSTLLVTIALFISMISYAVLPSIVGKEEINSGFSWRLVLFVIAKSVIGGCFACVSSLSSSVVFDVCGSANLSTIVRLNFVSVSNLGSAGPIVAWIVTMSRVYGGVPLSQSFNTFYIASGIACLLCLNAAWLHHRLHGFVFSTRSTSGKSALTRRSTTADEDA